MISNSEQHALDTVGQVSAQQSGNESGLQPALPHGETAAQPGPLKRASRGGAPIGNRNRQRHGLRGRKLPPDAKADETHIRELVDRVKADLEAKHGTPLPTFAEAMLQRIRRAETTARLAARWLRIAGGKPKQGRCPEPLSVAERVKLLELQNAASETITRCLERLGLESSSSNRRGEVPSIYRMPAPATEEVSGC